MARWTKKYAYGRWWTPEELDAARAQYAESTKDRLPCPMYISDRLDDVICPLNGRPYDSKSAYYQTVRDAGCEIAGNDSSLEAKPRTFSEVPNVERDIKTSIEQLRAGYHG